MGTLTAGAARACITPPMGTRMAGYAERTEGCRAAHDDLHAKALVLDNGKAKLALLTLDLIGMDGAQVAQVRKGVEVATDIPGDSVMVCCSHTHAGPVMPSSDPRRDPLGEDAREVPARVTVLVDTLAGLVRQADGRRQPVRLRYLQGSLPGLSMNRRRAAQGGTPVDPEVRTLVLTGEDEAPVAVVVNFTCHPTVMGGKNLTVTAEYPGAMARLVEAACPGCAALFVQGTCGNLNPNWFKLERASFGTIERMGRALGGEVLRGVYTGIATQPPEDDVTLKAVSSVAPLPLWPQPDLEGAREILKAQESLLARARAGGFPANPLPFWHSMAVDENLSAGTAESYVKWAQKLVRLAEGGIRVAAPAAEAQALRIGPGAIASLPGEAFMELGMGIKEAFPDRPVLVAGYTNGSLGYIPTREAFPEQGYEVTVAQRARTIPIAEGGGEMLVERAVEGLREIFERGKEEGKSP